MNQCINRTEFAIHPTCDVDGTADFSLRVAVIIAAGITLLAEIITWGKLGPQLWKKNIIPRSLLVLTTIQNIIMSLRPLLGILLYPDTTVTNVGIAVATHISCALAATIAILFLYLQARIIKHAARGIKTYNGCTRSMLDKSLEFFVAFEVIQVLLFSAGIPLGYYGLVANRIAFWIPVVVVDFTAVPFFMFLGINIYLQTRKSSKTRHQKLSKKIIITVVACAILCIFTGGVGIISSIGVVQFTDWIFVELCWLADIGFNVFIFWLLARKQEQKSVRPPEDTTSNGSGSNSSINTTTVDS